MDHFLLHLRNKFDCIIGRYYENLIAMNKWKKKSGIAIAINSFIASEKYQLSIVTGDHILVNEGNDDWLLGRNLFTHKVGIFPLLCVSFNEKSDSSINSFLSQKSDILIFEAEMTIRYAFVQLSSNTLSLNPDAASFFPILNISNHSNFINIFKLISDIISQIDFCKNNSGNSAIFAHSSLSVSVDHLRKALGLDLNQRSLYSSVSTISTWGRKFDPSNLDVNTQQLSTKSIDQPIVLHVHIGIKEVSRPILCSFYLYDAINKSFLSTPTTLNVDPIKINKSNNAFIVDLFYEKLEKKYISNSVYLIIYTFETKDIDIQKNYIKQPNKNDDKMNDNDDIDAKNETYSIKKCFSCVITKIPDLNSDSLGNSTIKVVSPFTIKRGKFNILTFPETISNNLPIFTNSNAKSQESHQEEIHLINELEPSEELEDQHMKNDIDENDSKKLFSSSYRDTCRYTRKPVCKMPPLLLDSPNIRPSGSFLSPPNSPRHMTISPRPFSTFNSKISPSLSSPDLSLIGSPKSEEQLMLEESLNKLNIKIIRHPLNFAFKITPYTGLVQNIFNEEKLQRGNVISPYHITSLASQNENKSIMAIHLRKLKLDVYHNKYTLVIVRLLDITQNTFIKCFQSFQDPTDFSCESWICPVIKSTIEDQFFDFFSINLNSTNLPISSLLLVLEIYKINSGFRDAKPIITSYGFLPLFHQNELSVPPNDGEISLYNCPKLLTPSEIITTYIQYNSQNLAKVKRPSMKKNEGNTEIIELVPNPKPIGSISYHIDSNDISRFVNLYKLFHHHEYANELKSLINGFMFYGVNDWLMNTSKILLNLCSIISSMDNELASEAFRVLQLMLSSLNTRFNESTESIINLIEHSFDPSNNSEFLTDLQNLADVLLPLIIDKLSNNPEINSSLKIKTDPEVSDQKEDENSNDFEFRNMIKTLPLFLQLVAHSYALKPNSDRKAKVRKIFDLLNQLLKRDLSQDKPNKPSNEQDNENEDFKITKEHQEAKIFMNQRLLLSHFWKLVDVLPTCFDKQFATDIICSFISSIKDDKESLFDEKMKLLLALSSKDIFWINNPSKNKLNDMFTHILNLAIMKNNYNNDIFQILTGIMYSSNSRFVITFLPFLETLIDTNRHDHQLIYMLFTIAFNFPESFPLRLLNKLVFPLKKTPQPQLPPNFTGKCPQNHFIVDYEEVLKNSERLFIYMYVIFNQKDEIIKKFKYKIFNIFEISTKDGPDSRLDSFTEQMTKSNFVLDSNTIKYKIFLDVFNIAISSTKPDLHPFDSYFAYTIYNFNNNFSILTYIFRSFTINQRLYLPLIRPLLHCMVLYPSKNLAELFYLILKADIKLNKEPTNVKNETLNSLWKISSNKYNKNGSYYTVKKNVDSNTNDEYYVLQRDETAIDRKETFRKLLEFNSCKSHSIADLATTLFSRESIPNKKNQSATTKQSTPKYKKGLVSKEQIKQMLENFVDLFNGIVRSIAQIRIYQSEIDFLNDPSLPRSDLSANEDKICESIRRILKSSIEIKNEKFWRELVGMLCRLHLICGNQIEAASSLNHYLSLIPCTNEYKMQIKRETLQLFIGRENNNKSNIPINTTTTNNEYSSSEDQTNTVSFKLVKNPLQPDNNNDNNSDDNADIFDNFCYRCIGIRSSDLSNDTKSPFYQLNGRQLHFGILLKIAEICIKSNNESLASRFIDQIQSIAVSKFRLIELMPLICDLRFLSVHQINTRSTPPSNFFRVSFYGKKFDKFYKNRTFIYRRDYKIDGLNKLRNELKTKFPKALLDTIGRQEDKSIPCETQNDPEYLKKSIGEFDGQIIIYQKAFPSNENELKDPFYDPVDLSSYVSQLSGGEDYSIFRCEVPIESESKFANVYPVCQIFLDLGDKKFPSIERRIEVNSDSKPLIRKIDQINFASLSLQRNVNQITKEKLRVNSLIEKSLVTKIKKDDQISVKSLSCHSSFLSFFMQDNVPNWKCYKDFFFNQNYLDENPDDFDKVVKLRGLFNQIVDLLSGSIRVLVSLKVPKTLKKEFSATEQLFKDLKSALSYVPNQ